MPASARLIVPGVFEGELLLEGVVVDELELDELVRGGGGGEFGEGVLDAPGDMDGLDDDVGGYVLEGELEGELEGAELGGEEAGADALGLLEGVLAAGELPVVCA